MRDVETLVANAPDKLGALDIAFEAPTKTARTGVEKETRADVVSIDLEGMEIRTRLGKVYRLLESTDMEMEPNFDNLADHVFRRVSEVDVMKWFYGEEVEFEGQMFGSLPEFLAAHPVEDEDEDDAPKNARTVTRVSPRLVQAVGFVPRAVVKVS